MKPKTFYFTILLISIISYSNFAQEPKVEWGEIPRSDLEMTSYPADTNATAVILYEYAESTFDDDFDIVLSVHKRIKILTKAGFDWGTETLFLNTEKGKQRLRNVEGATYSLNEKGEVVKTEFDDDEIYEDEYIKNRTSYKFTLPALKPGCVIEIRYQVISDDIQLIKDWTFQKSEPVRWSEYKVRFPRNLAYAIVKRGFEHWQIDEVNEVNQTFSGNAAALIGTENIKCWEYKWAVKDIPALRDEPYITTINDYTNVVNIQLAAYMFANGVRNQLFSDWKAMIEELLDYKGFGDKIDVTGDVEDLGVSITKGINDPLDKMKAIYNWVSKSIVWDGHNRYTADQDVDDVIEYKKGNSAEINFLLMSLLKSVGIDCNPVLLSTRDNGAIQDIYPIYYQFNYVIAQVKIGKTNYLLDPTNPLRPYDLLPSKILNTKGLVMQPDLVQWIGIKSDKKNVDRSMTLIHVNKDGSINGRLDNSFAEYNSVAYRKSLADKKDIDAAKDILNTESEGINIDSVKINNRDSIQASLNLISYITSDSYTQKNGDLIYLNPNLINRLKENPFKSKVRKFDIDYGYQNGDVSVVNIYIPDGYELKENLQNKTIVVENFASYTRMAGVENNMLQIINKLEINSSLVSSKYYTQLKEFYAQIVAMQAEQIVLGPKSASTEKTNEKNSKDSKGK